jgi:antitoxin component YwqK of YwqJK toxin-antitoxin module
MKNGSFTSYYEDGQVKLRTAYINDTEDGLHEYFYPNGQLNELSDMREGLLAGQHKRYQENGLAIVDENFKLVERTEVLPHYDNSDNMGRTRKYKVSVKDGSYIEYYENGREKLVGAYHGDKQVGLWLWYYSDGILWKRLSYVDNEKHGKEEIFYPAGNKHFVTFYHFGKKQGECLEYFGNGNLKSKKNYQHGLLNGDYIKYHIDGKIRLKASYKNNLKEGFLTSYDTDGKLSDKSFYRAGDLVNNPEKTLDKKGDSNDK